MSEENKAAAGGINPAALDEDAARKTLEDSFDQLAGEFARSASVRDLVLATERMLSITLNKLLAPQTETVR